MNEIANKEFMKKLDEYLEDDKYSKIIEEISSIDEKKQSYELRLFLAHAYSNRGVLGDFGELRDTEYEYTEQNDIKIAIEILENIKEDGKEDYRWYKRMANAYLMIEDVENNYDIAIEFAKDWKKFNFDQEKEVDQFIDDCKYYKLRDEEAKLPKEFWEYFKIKEKDIIENWDDENFREILFGALSERLELIDENLTFEFDPIKDGKGTLYISADGVEESFPIVFSLIKKAPSLKNWEFIPFKQRVEGDDFTIKLNDFTLSYEDIYFRYVIDENGLFVEFNVRNYDEEDDMMVYAVLTLLDALVGEYEVIYIDDFFIKELDEDNIDNLKPFIKLRDIVDSLKLQVH